MASKDISKVRREYYLRKERINGGLGLSEIGLYKSIIRLSLKAHASNIEASPSFEILKKSLEMVADDYGGMLRNYVVDSIGRKTPCDLAIVTPSFSRGVGIRIDKRTGEVTFLYDQYGGYGDVARKITEEITQNYVGIALIRAMKSLGYHVEAETSKERETVVLVGRV